ncbi:MAG: PIG-L family deacetylase [Bryobacterales bacterium]|nr:PIG-L family deacetylase [Bryobacterales bacterium]
MKFSQPTSEVYVPDAVETGAALARTTHMAIAAHQDDIEIMALDGILPCFGEAEQWFLGVIVTDGAGSPRDGLYGKYTDVEMRTIRRVEQKKAAFVGEYGAAVFLDHPSSGIKNPAVSGPKEDLLALLRAARPRVVYTHNLADKHDTHVAVALRTIAAIREMAPAERPEKLYGCEVWRDLDWMVDADKTVFQLDGHENIAAALLGVFDSQIAGGKRYDLATFGRRRAHATYHQSHGVDAAQMINFGMDLTPLVEDATLDIAGFVEERIARFSADVSARIGKSL